MEQKPPVQSPVDVTKKDRFVKIKEFLKKRPPQKRLAIVAGVSAGVLLMGTIAAFTLIKNPVESQPEPEVVSTYIAPPEVIPSPLTGVLVKPELAQRPVTAIMIENSVDARPHSGLIDAGIVYEAIAEGGITRFLALYQESEPSNIGPIRSARPYYVRWAAGYDASFVHVGGSPEALQLVRTLGLKDLDQSALGDRIASRVSNRYAPHNMYTDAKRINAMNAERKYTSSSFTPFERKEVNPPTEESPATARSIQFNISGANYNTSYAYDPDTNSYRRTMAGLPHNDQETGKQITPNVIVGLVMGYRIHPNNIHSIYDNIGSGEAYIFQDGKVAKATWRKSSDKASLELLDSDSKPVALNAGQTWITAIAPNRISYSP